MPPRSFSKEHRGEVQRRGAETPESNTLLKVRIFVIKFILIHFQKKKMLWKEDLEMKCDLFSEPALKTQGSKSRQAAEKVSHMLTSPILFLSIWILLHTTLLQWVVWKF